jgi:hypothetical protein
MYFLNFWGSKKINPIEAKRIKKAIFILHCSASGYIPYINLLIHTLTKTQHAPPLVQSCFVDPAKSASKINQFNISGIYLIKTKVIINVNIALKLFEFKLLLILSKNLFILF